jgi:hypothetical protein
MVYSLIGDGRVIASGAVFHPETPDGGALHRAIGHVRLRRGQFGMAVSAMLDLKAPQTLTCAAGIAALGLTAYYALFRVPFTVALIALSVYATVFGSRRWAGPFPKDAARHLPAQRGWALRRDHLVLGLVGLIVAMTLRHVGPASRDAAGGLGVLAACDRGAGHREHRSR